jgi:hypothetical protein
MNEKVIKEVQKAVGENIINTINEIQELLKIVPLDTKRIAELKDKLIDNSNVFGKITYPFWKPIEKSE